MNSLEHMADSKVYTVKATKAPGFLNKEMAIGGLCAALVPFGGFFLTPVVLVSGLGLGGYLGKKRMEQEVLRGHAVKPPTMKNSGALIGGLSGAVGGSFFTGIASTAGAWLALEALDAGFLASSFAATTATTGMTVTIPATIAAFVAGAGLLAGGLALAACIGAGILIGGWIKKKHMAKEYAAEQAKDPVLHPEYAKASNREQAPALEPSPEMQPTFSFRDKINAERSKSGVLTPNLS